MNTAAIDLDALNATLGTWSNGEDTLCAVAYRDKIQVTESGRLVAVESFNKWLERYDNLRDAGFVKTGDFE